MKQAHDNKIFYRLFTVSAIIAALLLTFLLQSCHTLKTVQHTTRDSVVVHTHDSTIYRYITREKDSTVIHDSVIGIAGVNAALSLAAGSTTDTTIKHGGMTIRRSVNAGVERIECNTDSLTIVVSDLQIIIRQKDSRIDSLSSTSSTLATSHSDVVVKEQQKGWLHRVWDAAVDVFAFLGLTLFLIWILKRFI